jgi:hypothetical protein
VRELVTGECGEYRHPVDLAVGDDIAQRSLRVRRADALAQRDIA